MSSKSGSSCHDCFKFFIVVVCQDVVTVCLVEISFIALNKKSQSVDISANLFLQIVFAVSTQGRSIIPEHHHLLFKYFLVSNLSSTLVEFIVLIELFTLGIDEVMYAFQPLCISQKIGDLSLTAF
jgi:hypothetical protein